MLRKACEEDGLLGQSVLSINPVSGDSQVIGYGIMKRHGAGWHRWRQNSGVIAYYQETEYNNKSCFGPAVAAGLIVKEDKLSCKNYYQR